MDYRDALDASKGCPRCCSRTLDRFKKIIDNTKSAPLPVSENTEAENSTGYKIQSKQKK